MSSKEKNNYSADYSNFSLVSGGLIYKLMTLSSRNKDAENGISRRALLVTAVAWLPLLIFTIILGFKTGEPYPKEFLRDFGIQIHLLFIIPFLIKIEKTVNDSFIEYIKASDDLVVIEQQDKFNKMVSRIDKVTNLYLPEIIMLILIYALAIYGINHHEIGAYKSYFVNPDTGEINAIAYYFLFVTYPIFQLLLFRWIWRWMVWAYSIYYISTLNMQIKAANIDKVAGLTYLNFVPFKFSITFITISIIIATNFGQEILYDGATLKDFSLDILFFIILVPALVYFPLLFFVPQLVKTKSDGVYHLGRTVSLHNREYMKKWTGETLPKNEELLGNPDHSSLSDINGGYGPVIDMTLMPINTKMYLMSSVILLLPFTPLVFSYYSITDLLKIILNAIG